MDRFRREAAEMPGPVLVHCASGKRSGAMVMMHMAAERGTSGDQVMEEAGSMGFEGDTPELERFVKSCVDRRDGS